MVDGRTVYPQQVEDTVADASPMVRRGYVAAFTIPGERLVVVADARPAPTAPTRRRRSRRSGRQCRAVTA